MRKINEQGLQIVEHFEGFRHEPYLDAVGIPTIGFGSTYGVKDLPVTMGHIRISKSIGRKLLQRDLSRAERAVLRNIRVHLTDNEFSALVSFTYNVGAGALQRSTLRMMLNRKDYYGAADELPKWRRAGGRILKGLVRRRAEEKALFLS